MFLPLIDESWQKIFHLEKNSLTTLFRTKVELNCSPRNLLNTYINGNQARIFYKWGPDKNWQYSSLGSWHSLSLSLTLYLTRAQTRNQALSLSESIHTFYLSCSLRQSGNKKQLQHFWSFFPFFLNFFLSKLFFSHIVVVAVVVLWYTASAFLFAFSSERKLYGILDVIIFL